MATAAAATNKGSGKRKRVDNKVTEASPPPPPLIKCAHCGLAVSSRNKLFRHLRNSSSCSSNNADEKASPSTNSPLEPSSSSNRKVILIVAYIGKAYHGSARNESKDIVPTIEGCLWQALTKAMVTAEENNANDETNNNKHWTILPSSQFHSDISMKTNPKGMTRSSRTDKGVSSLGNVYSLLLPSSSPLLLCYSSNGDDDEAKRLSTVNGHLPNDIRLLRFMVLCNNNDNTNNDICYQKIPPSFHARTCCEARRYRYLVPVNALHCKENPKEGIMDLRKRLKRVLLQWGGTHSFHNFTNWKSSMTKEIRNDDDDDGKDDDPNDDREETSSCFRHIIRCHVEDVIQYNDIDFIVISIKGQGFLYHQIRKMMGATIGVMNKSLEPDFITNALKSNGDDDGAKTSSTTVDVPLAPAEGLVLVEAIYSRFCSKHKMEPIGLGTKLFHREEAKDNTTTNLSWESAQTKLRYDTNEFQKRLYDQICQDQAEMFLCVKNVPLHKN